MVSLFLEAQDYNERRFLACSASPRRILQERPYARILSKSVSPGPALAKIATLHLPRVRYTDRSLSGNLSPRLGPGVMDGRFLRGTDVSSITVTPTFGH